MPLEALHMNPRPRALGTLLAALMFVVAGCTAPAHPWAPQHQGLLAQVGQATSPAAPTAKAATTKAPATKAAAVALPVDAAAAGRVEIKIDGLAARSLMATTAQISRIKVALTGGALPGAVRKEATASALAGGKGTITFEAIPAGTVDVTIEALDADGATLGEKATTATIARGETAVVAVALKLNPTHVASENGNLALDLTITDGDVIVDPIAPASPRPSSPVLSPAPLPTPTPTATPTATPTPTPSPATVALTGTLDRTWFADGTLKVRGYVENTGGTAAAVKVEVRWKNRGLIGWRVVETQTVDVGSVAAGAVKAFTATSTKKITNLFSDGEVEVEVTAP
jgi:hypothetical protein